LVLKLLKNWKWHQRKPFAKRLHAIRPVKPPCIRLDRNFLLFNLLYHSEQQICLDAVCADVPIAAALAPPVSKSSPFRKPNNNTSTVASLDSVAANPSIPFLRILYGAFLVFWEHMLLGDDLDHREKNFRNTADKQLDGHNFEEDYFKADLAQLRTDEFLRKCLSQRLQPLNVLLFLYF